MFNTNNNEGTAEAPPFALLADDSVKLNHVIKAAKFFGKT